MNYKSIRYILFIVSSLLLITTFQNCGQTGSISQSDTISAKASGTDPLVVDVVEEMDNVADNDDNVAENEDKKDYDRPVRDKKECERELEEVMEKYACDEDGSSKKVLVCHYPPGNPANKHTICIGAAALRAHMDHGHSAVEHQDHLGSCDDEQEPVDDDDSVEHTLPVQDP